MSCVYLFMVLVPYEGLSENSPTLDRMPILLLLDGYNSLSE